MTIRRFGPGDDLEAVARLEAASFRTPWTRERLARELQASAVTRLYVLSTDALPVAAFCLCWVVAGELHVNTVAVDASVRRRGLATALLRHVIAEAAAAGATDATLEVRRSNAPALALYERLGFMVEAVRPRYYGDTGEDALVLWRRGLADPSTGADPGRIGDRSRP